LQDEADSIWHVPSMQLAKVSHVVVLSLATHAAPSARTVGHVLEPP